ncbi:MAG: mobile mystery protein A [Gammaproteobacteria bacterium]
MKNLIRQQYQHKFDENLMTKNIRRPKEGWIRTLRKALGMSSPQLARILGLGKAQVSQMERIEIDDRITLKQLRRVAEELNCELVYALVPRASIREMIRERADFKAKKIIEAANQHMILESQQLDESSLNEQLNLETNRLIQDMPRDLWEE